jgi:hypothetical protein
LPLIRPGVSLFPPCSLTLLLILLLFRETALTMAAVWERSDTYAHGFIVPPITLWLIWRIRSSLAVLAPRYSFLAVLLFAGVGFAWLLGEVAAVNALSQFALVAMLILAVPAVLGWGVARRIAFPLLFPVLRRAIRRFHDAQADGMDRAFHHSWLAFLRHPGACRRPEVRDSNGQLVSGRGL